MVTLSIWLSVWLSFTAGTSGLIVGYLWFSAASEHHGERAPEYDRRREPLGLRAVYEAVSQKTAATV